MKRIPPFFLQVCLLIIFYASSTLPVSGQQAKNAVNGSVTDSSGAALPGVSIRLKGDNSTGTTTDVNGRFILDVPANATLTISMVGYDSREIVVSPGHVINVKLFPSKSALGEVVVTAFGRKERREAVVGSVTSIEPDKLRVPSSNLTTALAGRIAGLIAYQRNGQPGQDNASFFIRGVTTFGYNNNPLILVDGVELTATDLASMQIDDIASFSILKDASATALYGARGANGVILITTKEGKEGKAKVHVRIENSISQPTKNIQLADPITYMNLYNEAITTRDPLGAPLFSQNKINNTIYGRNPYVYPAVDWLGDLFKKRTSNQRANLSVTGGGSVAQYYISGSFSQDNGILKINPVNDFNSNVNLQNYQLRSNININITKSTEIIVRLSGTFDEYTGPITSDGSLSTDLYYKALHTSPVLFPAFFPPDSANIYTNHILFGNSLLDAAGSELYDNPYADLMKGYKNYSQSRMSAQFEINQDFSFLTKGLNFRGLFSTNRYSYFDVTRQYKPFYYSVGYYDKLTSQYSLIWLNNQPDEATEYLDFNRGNKDINTFLYLQGVLDYDRSFGSNRISGSFIATREQKLDASANSLESSLPYRNLGLAGRITYSYNDKYFLEFNFGYNGSERFSPDHRFGFFPTIGGSWIVSNETFWQGGIVDVISRLKLRATYGKVGNDNIGSQRFFYLSDVNLNGGHPASFGLLNGYSRNGVTINNYENDDVTWEISRKLNLATELTFFKDFNIVAEIYKEHRYNILQARTDIPSSMGLEAPISANVGEVDSKGLDLSFDFNHNFTRTFWVSGRGNLTITSNIYQAYEEPQYEEPWRYLTGQAVGQAFGYIGERLFVDDNEVANSPVQNFGGLPVKGGDIKYRDINGDGEITGRDRVPIGLPTIPQIVYGFGISAGGIKGFDISLFFQGLSRESFFINPESTAPFVNNTQLLKTYADSHWSEEDQNLYAIWPRMSNVVVNNNIQQSTWWLRNGSFLRLKSIEAGYTIPKKLSKRGHMDNIRIYFSGLNLWTLSSFKLWDPEMGGNGFAYPIQKVYNLGIRVDF